MTRKKTRKKKVEVAAPSGDTPINSARRPVVSILFVLGCGHITSYPAGGWRAYTFARDLAAPQMCPTCVAAGEITGLDDADYMYREQDDDAQPELMSRTGRKAK